MKIPKICRYCGGKVILADAKKYGIRGEDGQVYMCTICNACVGIHKGSGKPLGTLANAVLRLKRREAHTAFDAIWKSGEKSRSDAYEWLAVQMGLPKYRAHIAYFEIEQCEQVIRVCREHKNETEAA